MHILQKTLFLNLRRKAFVKKRRGVFSEDLSQNVIETKEIT
jgi:hypothetical protein